MLKAITRGKERTHVLPPCLSINSCSSEREREGEVQEGGGAYLGVDQKGRSLRGENDDRRERGDTHTYTTSIVASTHSPRIPYPSLPYSILPYSPLVYRNGYDGGADPIESPLSLQFYEE